MENNFGSGKGCDTITVDRGCMAITYQNGATPFLKILNLVRVELQSHAGRKRNGSQKIMLELGLY